MRYVGSCGVGFGDCFGVFFVLVLVLFDFVFAVLFAYGLCF